MDERNAVNEDMNRGKVQQVLGNYGLSKMATSEAYVEKQQGMKGEMWVGITLLKALNEHREAVVCEGNGELFEKGNDVRK